MLQSASNCAGAIVLSNGRRLAWSEWGARSGRVVLFCPGAGMAGALPFGEDDAKRLGLRLLSVDRPGLGRSDQDREKTFESWVADIRELLASFGLAKAPVIGFSQGGVFALALGAAGIADSVCVVAGTDELSHACFEDVLPPPIKTMVAGARSGPEQLLKSIAGAANAQWLWQVIAEMSSDQDRAFFTEQQFAHACRIALQEGFRQGALGYAQDTVLATRPWPFSVESISCPVCLCYGLKDASPVHSPDFGVTLASRISNSRLLHIEDAGSALLWTHAKAILELVR